MSDVADPLAEIKFWFKATATALVLDLLAVVGLQLARVPQSASATVLTLITGFVVLAATNLRTASQAKIERDAEARKRDAENRERQAELERVARKTEEVRNALIKSDALRTSQVDQLQGSVDTIHGKVNKIEGFVNGEHGVVLKALAASLAREASRPDATDQQRQAADMAAASSRKHDEQQAAFDAASGDEPGNPTSI